MRKLGALQKETEATDWGIIEVPTSPYGVYIRA